MAVDNIGRRKFDLAKYKGAPETDPDDPYGYAHGTDTADNAGKVVVREPLKRRNYEVDLWGQVGKYQVVSGNSGLSQRGGYFCDVCDCLLKDSTTYLDHINGKKHQRRLGMNMKVERATLAQVRKRLQLHKDKKEGMRAEIGVEERMRRHEQEMRRRKKRRAEDDDSENEDKSGEEEQEEEGGEGGKGGKGGEIDSADERSGPGEDDEDTARPKKQNGEEEEEEAEEEAESEEAAMAKLMGFGSFTASKVKQ